ncbi:DUF961 family protein [Streptococcus canis]|uniref:DUF961 family protein n=1 Tax=Streptococcus canis TaxID=1329 RepID=UPI00299B96C6|nr:DUF961 family protein [Streptococcus canis]
MTVKFANNLIETFDTAKTVGTLNFLEAIAVMKWEDYVDESTGEEKRRETSDVDYVDVKLYSSAVNGDITVTVPPQAKVAQMTAEKNYNDEVTLVSPTARFWTNTETINGRRMTVSGVKLRAKDIVPVTTAKPETKKE